MYVAGIDGCKGGWVAFKVELATLATSVETVDLTAWLKRKPAELAWLGIDIPIGLLDGSRACDKAARKLLGQPRGTSVFAAPCRASLAAKNHADASAMNLRVTGRGLSQQAFGIAPKIKQVDDAITPECQNFIQKPSGIASENRRWFYAPGIWRFRIPKNESKGAIAPRECRVDVEKPERLPVPNRDLPKKNDLMRHRPAYMHLTLNWRSGSRVRCVL